MARGVQINVNAALTGTIIIATLGSTQYGTAPQTIGTITNPSVGATWRSGGLTGQGQVTITTNAVCDLTVTKLNRIL